MVTPEELTQSERELFLDAVFAVTSGEAWLRVQAGLQEDIKGLIEQELSSESFDEIKELRGFRRALQYVHDMRELAKTEKNSAAL